MTTLLQASNNWMTRPSDERYLSLLDMQTFKNDQRAHSNARVVTSRALSAAPPNDNKDVVVVGPNGNPIAPTHWSFGQLASLAGAPAGYLRKLPAPVAADCLNYGLQVERQAESVGVLLHQNGGAPALRAATGPAYGRIWDADILHHLIDNVGDGVTGDWRVPGEFGKPVTVTKANTTLYASDRDMFVFLADEKNLIEVPGAGRNGETELLSRGFFVSNSEVGSATLSISTFLYRYVCCNRMVWGARDVDTIKIRHAAHAPDRFIEEVIPALEDYSAGSTRGIIEGVTNAINSRLDDDKVDAFLATRFGGRKVVNAIKTIHQEEEGRPIASLWDAAQGATAYARGFNNQDQRVALERKAGDIIDLAA